MKAIKIKNFKSVFLSYAVIGIIWFLGMGRVISAQKVEIAYEISGIVFVVISTITILLILRKQTFTIRREKRKADQTKNSFQLVFQASDHPVIAFRMRKGDSNRPIVELNDAASRLLGYSKEEIMKLSPHNIIAPKGEEPIADIFQTLRKEKLVHFSADVHSKDGKKIPVDISAHLLYVDDQLIAYAFIKDVTERSRYVNALRETSDKFKALVECANDAIFVVQENIIVFVNPRFLDYFGYSLSEVYSDNFRLNYLVSEKSRDKSRELLRKINERKASPSSHIFIGRTKMGNEIHLEANFNYITWDDNEALKLSEEYKGAIHLLLTDIIMPGLRGNELAEAMIEQRNNLNVLFMSAYPGEAIKLNNETIYDNFIQKPFYSEILMKKVKNILQ